MHHVLPPLPYESAALEPYIDERTLTVHHEKHHASYVNKLNSVLKNYPELHERKASWLLRHLGKVPSAIRETVRNNAGGHVNHSLYWHGMSPPTGGGPGTPLAEAIEMEFGGLEKFKTLFVETGSKLFGSGWVWLAMSKRDGGRLQVYATPGHDNPLMQGHYPIMVNDVWEHAYYLRYQNRRDDYLNGWWAVANWEEATRRFVLAGETADHVLEGPPGTAVAPTLWLM